MMQVLSGWQTGGGAVTQEQWEADYPILLERHKKALKSSPTWAFFGGTITIENRTYQVC